MIVIPKLEGGDNHALHNQLPANHDGVVTQDYEINTPAVFSVSSVAILDKKLLFLK